ncbi:MAG TPA: hypothetical protein VK595_03815, partial [Vicinamibacterales bacterium]|nr:hypothetical protein [Vicinamibacterales bacterium]
MRLPGFLLLIALVLATSAAESGQSAAPRRAPSDTPARRVSQTDVRKLDAIQPLVDEAIAGKKLPGAVVLV